MASSIKRNRRTQMFGVKIDENVTVSLNKASKGLKDQTDVLEEFHLRMISRIDRTFELAGGEDSAAQGGYDPFRNIKWPAFKPQYTRKNGKVNPAWGNIPTADGRGRTKGRLRPSGRRITPSSKLNQDTGRFRQRAATGYVSITRNSLTFGPDLNYASYIEEIRPAVFISNSDAALLEKMLSHSLFGDIIKNEDFGEQGDDKDSDIEEFGKGDF